jgi:proteic killer suppression protein
MDITFEDNKLEKCANDRKKAIKKLGQKRADEYQKRLDDLKAANTLEEVRNLPGNYHELKANRKGQWACNLDYPYRLIFVPHEDGQYIWVEIKGVEIIAIADYH